MENDCFIRHLGGEREKLDAFVAEKAAKAVVDKAAFVQLINREGRIFGNGTKVMLHAIDEAVGELVGVIFPTKIFRFSVGAEDRAHHQSDQDQNDSDDTHQFDQREPASFPARHAEFDRAAAGPSRALVRAVEKDCLRWGRLTVRTRPVSGHVLN